ncbi:MAG TPA: phage holin family protein [Gemmata sp.]|nr:phage holin family protein [Gemmata sp.]
MLDIATNREMIESPGVAPPDDPPRPGNGTLTALVTGIVDDVHSLVRQQVEMLQAEVKEDFRRSKRAAEFGALGIVMLTVGILGIIAAGVYFLHEHYQLSMWVSWGIIGGCFLIVGAALAITSYVMLERFNPLPDKTFNALQENLTWKTRK